MIFCRKLFLGENWDCIGITVVAGNPVSSVSPSISFVHFTATYQNDSPPSNICSSMSNLYKHKKNRFHCKLNCKRSRFLMPTTICKLCLTREKGDNNCITTSQVWKFKFISLQDVVNWKGQVLILTIRLEKVSSFSCRPCGGRKTSTGRKNWERSVQFETLNLFIP